MHWSVGALVLCAASCDGTACLAIPCPLPVAINITVTSSLAGGAITGVFVQVPAFVTPIPCNGSPAATCIVTGGPGTYGIDIGATGFQTVHRFVVVTGSSSSCGCTYVATQHLDVALVPAT